MKDVKRVSDLAKKVAEAGAKVKSMERQVKLDRESLERDIRLGHGCTNSRIDLEHSAKKLESLYREYEHLQSELRSAQS